VRTIFSGKKRPTLFSEHFPNRFPPMAASQA